MIKWIDPSSKRWTAVWGLLSLLILIGGVALISSGPTGTLAGVKTTVKTAYRAVARPVTPSDHLKIPRARQAHGRRGIPTGRGIIVAQVEGAPSSYAPNTKDQHFRGVRFIALEGQGRPSGHATFAAKQIFGKTGVAPGVKLVYNMSYRGFLNKHCLNAASALPPTAGKAKVYTHSWILSAKGAYANDILNRIDYLIDTQDVIMVVGVNNGSKTSVPPLLAGAYNVISVGTWTGNNSNGYTPIGIAGPGRCKPEVVGPSSKTSFATPMVAGVAARLLEKAYGQKDKTWRKSEVIKALILGGAESFGGFKTEKGKPLSKQIGAGRVRFDRSYLMQIAGNQKSGLIKQTNAWSYRSSRKGQSYTYAFTLRGTCPQLSATLVWNRQVAGKTLVHPKTKQKQWVSKTALADFDLELIHIDSRGNQRVIQSSKSKIDNVERITANKLKAGRYKLIVKRADKLPFVWDYALAWRMD